MKTRRKAAPVVVLVGCILALCVASWCVTSAISGWRPHSQKELFEQKVYAYRLWQSTGLYLKVGDRVTMTASGTWSYSPVAGYHGPAGGRWAPPHYPQPSELGGALLGRVGEAGQTFLVGRGVTFVALEAGTLYLGINDDLLGDNSGELAVKIKIVSPTAAP